MLYDIHFISDYQEEAAEGTIMEVLYHLRLYSMEMVLLIPIMINEVQKKFLKVDWMLVLS